MTNNRGSADAGASLAETALLIAVVALAAAIAIRALGSSGEGSLQQAGKGIHHASAPAEGGGGSTGGAGGGSGGGGSGGSGGGSVVGGGSGGDSGSTTTSAAATATTAPVTTTAPPTTTTAPPTTTTAPPAPASATLDGGQGVRTSSTRWQASADLVLDIDRGEGPLSGTATVIVRTRRANGQWSSQTIEVPFDQGSGTISTGPYAWSGGSRIVEVEYEVVGVELDGGRGWDGDRPSISIPRPS